jgi:1,2-diacylglycerol 3-beta-glucosyltransferase
MKKRIKDRITLAVLILFLWVFLFLFQKFIPNSSSTYIVLTFMAVYALMLHLAQYHRRRKERKSAQKEEQPQKQTYKPFVSILIPAHNEANVIEETLKTIFSIDYKQFEVIVIDDRSTDNIVGILRSLVKKYPNNFKYFTRNKDSFPGKSAVLNDALKISTGEVICVFDADARVKPDFLNKILPYLADKEVGAVQARKVISNKDVNLLTMFQNNEYALDTHFQMGRDAIRGAVELRGNGELIKKEALVVVHGWNDFSITDDLDLSTRLHLKHWDIRFCPDVEVYEEGVLEFLPLLKQRRRWVEGSIRRYLDYFTEVLFSKGISLRVSLDMLAYISEFVLPIWLVSEWFIQGVRTLRDGEFNILSSLALIPLICAFFVLGLIYGIKKYNKIPFWKAVLQSILTGFYMMIIWTPIVTFIVFKITFFKRSMDWGKTEHGKTNPDLT